MEPQEQNENTLIVASCSGEERISDYGWCLEDDGARRDVQNSSIVSRE